MEPIHRSAGAFSGKRRLVAVLGVIVPACLMISVGIAAGGGVLGGWRAASPASLPTARSSLSPQSSPISLTELANPDAQSEGAFGFSISVSGAKALVGAPGTTVGGLEGAGQASIFNLTTDAVTLLNSPTPQADGWFGWSVAIDTKWAVVGEPGESGVGQGGPGTVYVFSTSTGHLVSTLTSPNLQYYRLFGYSVAVQGSTVVVGDPLSTGTGGIEDGNVYLFNAKSGQQLWSVSSPNPVSAGQFGHSVAVDGARVLVGAPEEGASPTAGEGYAYTFNFSTGQLLTTFVSPNAQLDGEFGYSVALSGKKVVIGAPDETVGKYTETGNAYLFSAASGTVVATLADPNEQYYENFGLAVAITTSKVWVGVPYGSPSSLGDAGYVYEYHAGSGALITTLTSPNAQTSGEFGWSVAASGHLVAIGARFEATAGVNDAGTAYIS